MNKIKKQYEDEFPLQEGLDTIIPLSLTKFRNGRIRCTFYPSVENIVDEYVEKYINSPLSEDAIVWLDEKLTQFAAKHGYSKDDSYPPSIINKYRLNNSYAVQVLDFQDYMILGNTRKIALCSRYENLTTIDINELLSDNLDGFCTICDGKVVSIACENTRFDDSSSEITVETAPQYRGQGFASSNVAALSRQLLKRVPRVHYCCRESNIASNNTALRAGFDLYARTFYFCAYKNM